MYISLDVSQTCRMWNGTGDEGIEVADKTVITSGLRSAFSWSDINGLSREMLQINSNTPDELTGKLSVNEVSPRSWKKKVLPLMIDTVSET